MPKKFVPADVKWTPDFKSGPGGAYFSSANVPKKATVGTSITYVVPAGAKNTYVLLNPGKMELHGKPPVQVLNLRDGTYRELWKAEHGQFELSAKMRAALNSLDTEVVDIKSKGQDPIQENVPKCADRMYTFRDKIHDEMLILENKLTKTRLGITGELTPEQTKSPILDKYKDDNLATPMRRDDFLPAMELGDQAETLFYDENCLGMMTVTGMNIKWPLDQELFQDAYSEAKKFIEVKKSIYDAIGGEDLNIEDLTTNKVAKEKFSKKWPGQGHGEGKKARYDLDPVAFSKFESLKEWRKGVEEFGEEFVEVWRRRISASEVQVPTTLSGKRKTLGGEDVEPVSFLSGGFIFGLASPPKVQVNITDEEFIKYVTELKPDSASINALANQIHNTAEKITKFYGVKHGNCTVAFIDKDLYEGVEVLCAGVSIGSTYKGKGAVDIHMGIHKATVKVSPASAGLHDVYIHYIDSGSYPHTQQRFNMVRGWLAWKFGAACKVVSKTGPTMDCNLTTDLAGVKKIGALLASVLDVDTSDKGDVPTIPGLFKLLWDHIENEVGSTDLKETISVNTHQGISPSTTAALKASKDVPSYEQFKEIADAALAGEKVVTPEMPVEPKKQKPMPPPELAKHSKQVANLSDYTSITHSELEKKFPLGSKVKLMQFTGGDVYGGSEEDAPIGMIGTVDGLDWDKKGFVSAQYTDKAGNTKHWVAHWSDLMSLKDVLAAPPEQVEDEDDYLKITSDTLHKMFPVGSKVTMKKWTGQYVFGEGVTQAPIGETGTVISYVENKGAVIADYPTSGPWTAHWSDLEPEGAPPPKVPVQYKQAQKWEDYPVIPPEALKKFYGVGKYVKMKAFTGSTVIGGDVDKAPIGKVGAISNVDSDTGYVMVQYPGMNWNSHWSDLIPVNEDGFPKLLTTPSAYPQASSDWTSEKFAPGTKVMLATWTGEAAFGGGGEAPVGYSGVVITSPSTLTGSLIVAYDMPGGVKKSWKSHWSDLVVIESAPSPEKMEEKPVAHPGWKFGFPMAEISDVRGKHGFMAGVCYACGKHWKAKLDKQLGLIGGLSLGPMQASMMRDKICKVCEQHEKGLDPLQYKSIWTDLSLNAFPPALGSGLATAMTMFEVFNVKTQQWISHPSALKNTAHFKLLFRQQKVT